MFSMTLPCLGYLFRSMVHFSKNHSQVWLKKLITMAFIAQSYIEFSKWIPLFIIQVIKLITKEYSPFFEMSYKGWRFVCVILEFFCVFFCKLYTRYCLIFFFELFKFHSFLLFIFKTNTWEGDEFNERFWIKKIIR